MNLNCRLCAFCAAMGISLINGTYVTALEVKEPHVAALVSYLFGAFFGWMIFLAAWRPAVKL